MNRLAMLAAIPCVAIFLPGAAQAMPIVQFDKMAVADQSEYMGDLVRGAEKILTETRKPDLARKVEQLFTTKDPLSVAMEVRLAVCGGSDMVR